MFWYPQEILENRGDTSDFRTGKNAVKESLKETRLFS